VSYVKGAYCRVFVCRHSPPLTRSRLSLSPIDSPYLVDLAGDVALSRLRGHSAGGKDFSTALTYHTLDTKDIGSFIYLPVGNLVSYITKTRTGKTPGAYAAEKVFPFLGITDEDYDWYMNRDDVELGFHGLNMNTRTLSKLPMLYMQRGLASEADRVLTEDWVDRTFTAGDKSPDVDPFGYFYWVGIEPVYCTYGFLGQRACFNNETNRALAIFSEDSTGIFGEGGEDPDAPRALENADSLVKLFLMDAPSSPNSCDTAASNPNVQSDNGGTSSAFGSLASTFLVLVSLVLAPAMWMVYH